MRVLAIDCATEACSVALFEDGELIDARYEVLGRGHAERLVPMIEELPGKGRADTIHVSLGPGSFTGTRIGIAAAKALGLAWSAVVRGYPTLSLVAAMARQKDCDTSVLVAMQGGHGEFFVQEFGPDGMARGAHRSLKPSDAAAYSDTTLVAGSKAEQLVELRGTGIALAILPDAASANLVPRDMLTDHVSPIYGRAPDAKLPA